MPSHSTTSTVRVCDRRCVHACVRACPEVTARVRALLVRDRALVERSTRAFVSMVRMLCRVTLTRTVHRFARIASTRCVICSVCVNCRLVALRWGVFVLSGTLYTCCACRYGLLRFPRMPEARQRAHSATAGFVAHDVDIAQVSVCLRNKCARNNDV
jgi:hypothetical protein